MPTPIDEPNVISPIDDLEMDIGMGLQGVEVQKGVSIHLFIQKLFWFST
jgi:hypothetical protein